MEEGRPRERGYGEGNSPQGVEDCARVAALPAEQERGDAFEVFAKAYLATQKLAEEVWPANQVPMAVLQACCLPI
jgi:hypothetical protein